MQQLYWSGEMVHLVKCQVGNRGDLNSDPKNPHTMKKSSLVLEHSHCGWEVQMQTGMLLSSSASQPS